MDSTYFCGYCYKNSAKKKCSGCENIHYCDVNCQKNHWQIHRVNCKEYAAYTELRRPAKKIFSEKINYIVARTYPTFEQYNFVYILFENVTEMNDALDDNLRSISIESITDGEDYRIYN